MVRAKVNEGGEAEENDSEDEVKEGGYDHEASKGGGRGEEPSKSEMDQENHARSPETFGCAAEQA